MRALLAALLAAQACRCGQPAPAGPALECDAAHPCGPWKRCAFNACQPDPRAPGVVSLAVEGLPAGSDGAHRVHVSGSAEAGTQVRLFGQGECLPGHLVATLAAEELARGRDLAIQALYITPSAQAVSPAGVESPCTSLPTVKLPEGQQQLLAEARVASLEEAEAAHAAKRAAHAQLVGQLPPGLTLPGQWFPFAGEVVSLDLNCDGVADLAIPVVERDSLAARGLTAELSGPALLRWTAAAREAGRLLVALSAPGGGFAFEVHGRPPAREATVREDCEILPRAELAWLKAHGCHALTFDTDNEQSGDPTVVFDRRSGKLVELHNDCE